MSHDFDYIAYVPFRNYAGWGVAWYSAGTASYYRECGGESMARSIAKNNSSLTWATRFSVCTTLWAAERRVTGLVAASTGPL